MIKIEYCGTRYSGWQIQPEVSTVQEIIQNALEIITGNKTILRAAGRTDARVHAREQLAVFNTEKSIDSYKLSKSLNALIPKDVSIIEAIETPLTFDLKKEIISKTYIYRIHAGIFRPAMDTNHYWLKASPPLEKFKQLIPLLTGTKDFHAFRASNCGSPHSVKTLHDISISEHKYHTARRIYIAVNGSGFLKNMVRIIAGTMIDYALNKLTFKQIETALTPKGKREMLGMTAPPEGLTLENVLTRSPLNKYEKNYLQATETGHGKNCGIHTK